MKTLFSTVLIAVLALGFLLAVSPTKADAWHGGPRVGISVVVPPVGISIGTPYPSYYGYYPAPVYVEPYPVYGRAYYYGPYYRPYYRYRYWDGHRHLRRY